MSADELTIDVKAQQRWVMQQKQEKGLSWKDLETLTGVPAGTLSSFGPGKYTGNNETVADRIWRYRNTENSQLLLGIEAPETPDFIATPTWNRIRGILLYGHRAKMVSFAGGPGIGKTLSIRQYCAENANAYYVTITPSTAGVPTMQVEVLAALGQSDAVGTPQKLSVRIRDRLRKGNCLLIFDEAQHLSEKALEEIRSWYDLVDGLGIALFGNHHVISKLQSDKKGTSFAQLFSRISMKQSQLLPTTADAAMLLDAWRVTEVSERTFLTKISQQPGGLRQMSMVIELASMLAVTEQRARCMGDIREAAAQLSNERRV